MQSFSLPTVRVYELATVIDSLEPKVLQDLKSIRLANGIVNDLKQVVKPFADKNDSILARQLDLLKPYQEEYKQADAAGFANEEVKQAFAKDLDARYQKEVNEKFKEEVDALNLTGKELITVELSDEKFSKLKELFEKHSAEKYLKKDVLVEVADALKI
jgi:hypothetical protein